MKNIPFHRSIKPAVSRLRVAAGDVLVLAAAALAGVAANPNPPKLPWAAPIISVGHAGDGLAGVPVDRATNTIHVASGNFVGESTACSKTPIAPYH